MAVTLFVYVGGGECNGVHLRGVVGIPGAVLCGE